MSTAHKAKVAPRRPGLKKASRRTADGRWKDMTPEITRLLMKEGASPIEIHRKTGVSYKRVLEIIRHKGLRGNPTILPGSKRENQFIHALTGVIPLTGEVNKDRVRRDVDVVAARFSMYPAAVKRTLDRLSRLITLARA